MYGHHFDHSKFSWFFSHSLLNRWVENATKNIVRIQDFVLIPKSCTQIDVNYLFLVNTCIIVGKTCQYCYRNTKHVSTL